MIHETWLFCFNFYQPAARFMRGRLVLRLLCVSRVCWYIYICASALITCAIITSHTLHCCHATLLSQLLQFRRLLCVATTSSLAAQLRIWNEYREAEATYTRRREADWERKRQKRAAIHGAYRLANQQTMAARRALEWIWTSKARIFRYEISDLFIYILLPFGDYVRKIPGSPRFSVLQATKHKGGRGA